MASKYLNGWRDAMVLGCGEFVQIGISDEDNPLSKVLPSTGPFRFSRSLHGSSLPYGPTFMRLALCV